MATAVVHRDHPLIHRPLQIIPPFETWAGSTEEAIRNRIRGLVEAGLGGLVTNVRLENYLRDPASWELLVRGIRIAKEAGLRVWIYDEEGYPSGAAGGLTLEKYPAGEAQGLIRIAEEGKPPRFETIRLYEATHATENFYKKRPYLNILDPAAVAAFIEVTHDRYARALDPISLYIEAFFTDEPSLISAYVPKDREYPPTLPWHPRLPSEFLRRKGYDLRPHLDRLFVDVDPADRMVRCDFYEVIADLCADTYFGQLQEWCRCHGVASSGHLLGEETMVWQTDFNGEPFASYRKFDIPGIDMILSDPVKIMAKEYFLVPKIAGSAARLQGSRRVMCEISDFFGEMEKHPASMEEILCTTGLLYSFGVTELLSYYSLSFAPDGQRKPTEYSPAAYRRWTDFATRLHEIVAGGTIRSRVAFLYPITSIWAHFTPSHRSMYEPHPSAAVCRFDEEFTKLCRSLLQHQVDYDIVDERSMAGGRIDGRRIAIGNRSYEVIVLPPADTLRTRTVEVLESFVASGGTLLASPTLPIHAAEGPEADRKVREGLIRIRNAGGLGGSNPGAPPLAYLVRSRLAPEANLEPASSAILCTAVERPEDLVILLVNVSPERYQGSVGIRGKGSVRLFDPASGEEHPAEGVMQHGGGRRVSLTLPPFATLCLISAD